jgi:ureidoacrylate peracid hydrolase
MKDMNIGKYNAWYFDEILPGEEQIYKEAQKEYYQHIRPWIIEPKKAALLIIDLQNAFCHPEKGGMWVPAVTKMMPKMKRMLAFCREHGIPVCFTAHQHHKSGRDVGLMGTYNSIEGAGVFTEGTWQIEIYPEIQPLPDEWVINHKRRNDAFIETGLELWLKSLGKDTIILTGCCTNFCCLVTTCTGMQRDYKIAYPYDLNACDDPEIHEQIVKTMARHFARVQTCDEWIAEIEEQL